MIQQLNNKKIILIAIISFFERNFEKLDQDNVFGK